MEEQYKTIEDDSPLGESSDYSTLTPLEQLKLAAKHFDIDIKDPNKNCKKCNGRGYLGIRWNPVLKKLMDPIPCKCIYPKMNKETEQDYNKRPFIPKNRKEKRMVMKLNRRGTNHA